MGNNNITPDDINRMNEKYWDAKDGIHRSPVFTNRQQDLRSNAISPGHGGVTMSMFPGDCSTFGRSASYYTNYPGLQAHSYSVQGTHMVRPLVPPPRGRGAEMNKYPGQTNDESPEAGMVDSVRRVELAKMKQEPVKDKDGCYSLDHSRKIMEDHK